MAILRTRDRLNSPAPPPSPIATAKGSRSAAVDDQILSEYLEKTLQVPDLTLPESYFPASAHRQIPADIDLESLMSRENVSVRQILDSAMEFGMFRIKGHGVSAEELRSTMAEAELVFGFSAEKKKGQIRNFGRRGSSREELFWFHPQQTMVEAAQKEIAPEIYRSLSQRMESVASRLQAVAEQVGHILSEYAGKRPQKIIHEGESVIYLYRYHPDTLIDPIPPPDKEKNKGCSHHALSLHLSFGHSAFYIQSSRGLLSFNTSSDTIVVTVGKQLEVTNFSQNLVLSGSSLTWAAMWIISGLHYRPKSAMSCTKWSLRAWVWLKPINDETQYWNGATATSNVFQENRCSSKASTEAHLSA
ncbi:hypothetical protein HHK36_018773 [Tetracentron sinense]|uniref:Non-haem dioxygenase N-terminal domain-containing protein n=1 Tax=Tetracentron sinense TaxID=13715 RepID=A0A834Z006_TETSI|nr:hypothetical protein HHK36_018773 [Tetracentron sinense]